MAFTVNYSQSGFSQQEVTKVAEQLLSSQDDLRKINFIQKQQVTPTSYPSIILIGIGGSSLGARAIMESLRVDMRVTYLDMVDPRALEQALTAIEKDEQEVILVSKSGQTLETLVNFEILAPKLKHCTVVTSDDTVLADFARKRGFTFIELPEDIGGRFSLFTAGGLVPLAAAGIDIDKLCASAEKMRVACLGSDPVSNPALYSAALAYLHVQQGKPLHTLMYMDPQLHGIAMWWRQLTGESLGKDGKGVTPIASDPRDLHAMFQRYAEGPKDIFTSVLSVEKPSYLTLTESPLLPALANKKLTDITNAISEGVLRTYASLKLPAVHVHLESLDEETMGAFCMWKMMETIYIAKLMGVDTFTQPAVEIYKSEIKKILGT